MKSFSGFVKETNEYRSYDEILSTISEAVSISDMQRVGSLISSYFSRKLGAKLIRLPGGEEYFNETGSGFGVRFFMASPINGFDSIRFNWRKKKINSAAVDSVDLFSKGKNVYNITFDQDTSLVKILPFMFEFIEKPSKGYVSVLPEANLNEARGENVLLKVDEILKKNGVSEPIGKSQLYDMIKSPLKKEKPSVIASKLFDALKATNPHLLVGSGRRQKMNLTGDNLQRIADELHDFMYTRAKVTSGSKKETYKADDQVEDLEAQGLERLSFEQQLDDMRQAIRLLHRGVTNAVFIGGRGGIGKTFNVEQVLDELGLQDGDGYFKNAGSISAAGLYRLLFKERDNLIMFDDSDNVFGDQEARNILKGATDTKPVRKIAWSKQSSDIIPADEFSDDDEDAGNFPSFFEFTGQIIFISNLDTDKLDPDGALRTRGILMDIDPTDQEIYDLMEKIVGTFELAEGLTLSEENRIEVVNVLRDNPSKSPNFRTLSRALNMRAGWDGGGWERYVIYYA
jgi:hypothetical protein